MVAAMTTLLLVDDDPDLRAMLARSSLRRTKGDPAPPTVRRIGDVFVHLPGGEVERAGERVALSMVQTRILALLGERSGTVVGRDA